MQAVITAGGKGTRLSTITHDLIPKPMVSLADKPLLEHLVDCLIDNGIKDIIIIVGHLGEKIISYFRDGSQKGIQISYIKETEALGSAGGMFYLKKYINEDFIFLYADILLDIDFNRMYAFHKEKNAEATLLVHPNSHPFDSDLVIHDIEWKVTALDYKDNIRDYDYYNCVNAGAFIFSPEFLNRIKEPKKLGLEKDILSNAIMTGARVFAYQTPEYAKDVGTPDRLAIGVKEYNNGIVYAKQLRTKQRAVFLDRDGTINVYKGYITNPDQIDLIPNAAEAIRKLNQSGYLTVIITNQPVIARGDCSYETLELIHKRLITLLGREGAYIDDLMYCPHHPDKGYAGEIKELKINCNCRKPKTGMIDKFVDKYNIDLSMSWMVGDTYRDIQTGLNAGCKTILVDSIAKKEEDTFFAEADYHVCSIIEAIETIMQTERKYR